MIDDACVDIAVHFRQESNQDAVIKRHDIVMVDIDDESIEALGRVQQWPRLYDAQVLAYIGSGHPKAIGTDLIYTEHDTLPPVYRDLLNNRGLPNAAEVLDALSTDMFLEKAVEMCGNVFLAMYDDQETKHPTDSTMNAYLPPMYAAQDVTALYHKLRSPTLPYGRLRAAARGVGSINEPTQGGLVRRYVVVQVLPHAAGSKTVPLIANFPVLMAMHALGVPTESLLVRNGRIAIGEQRSIPVNEHGEFLINWLGNAEKFRHISYHKILEEQIPPEFFEDKYVILGATAAGLNDTKSTPRGYMPGMEVHATALLNIMNGSFLHELTLMEVLPWLALLAIALQFLFLRLSPFPALAVALGLVGIEFVSAALYVYPSMLLVVPVSLFTTLTVVTATASLVYKYMTEGRERMLLKRAFETYVPPDVVGEILNNAGALQLGGVKTKLTVLFSDIRGFTTFSEALDPQELVAFLNFYLSRMSDVIFRNKGTIDKFIGDAVMAIFGAPMSRPDNAARACATSLDMMKELDVVNERQRQFNQPEAAIGIGLNSGEMTVGNIGSEQRFDYTVIGDAVNLGSRLEGLNKYFHTSILVSESVKDEAGEEFLFREMAPVKVKGKDIPVGVYELLDHASNRAAWQPWLDQFAKAHALYVAGKLAEALPEFEECRRIRPKDGGSLFFIERCQEYLDHPEEFSVVIKMEGK